MFLNAFCACLLPITLNALFLASDLDQLVVDPTLTDADDSEQSQDDASPTTDRVLESSEVFKELSPPNPVPGRSESSSSSFENHAVVVLALPPMAAVTCVFFLTPDPVLSNCFVFERFAMTTCMSSPENMAVNVDSATPPPHAVFVFDPGGPHRDAFHSAVRHHLRAASFRSLDGTDGFHSDDAAAYGPASTWPWVPWSFSNKMDSRVWTLPLVLLPRNKMGPSVWTLQ